MKRPFAVELRRGEKLGGVIWLLMYMLGMGFLVTLLMTFLGFGADLVKTNQVFFVANFLITCVLFRHFLADSLGVAVQNPGRLFKGILLGFCLYEIGQVAVGVLYSLVAPDLSAINDEGIAEIAGMNYGVMWAGAVLLAPLVEETLMRGLVFGGLRKKSRALAYVVSVLIFSLLHVLGYVLDMGAVEFLMNLGLYLVPGIVLAVTYEYTGTVWGPIALHMILNGISMTALGME